MQLSERTYPVLSRVCIGVGVTFLLLSAFGNWRFGWSLSADPIDQWWLAIIYAGSDVAAGVLVATGATMLRHPGWQWKIGGSVALIPATILVALSVLSTFGMMSGRIAVLSGQKAALVVDEGRLKWLRGQTMNRELPKAERRAFLIEERTAAKKTREAAAIVTDSQAVAIANAAATVGVKLTVEQTQIGLTFVSSTMPMTIKFVCIWLGFFLYSGRTMQAADAAKKTQAGSPDGSGGEPRKPTLVHRTEPPRPAAAQGGRGEKKGSPLLASPTASVASGAGHKVRDLHEVHDATARFARSEPNKVRGVSLSSDAPNGKLTFEQFSDLVRQDMAHGEPASSTRSLAAAAGWSQTSVVRQQKKVKGQAHTKPRRFAGNGGGRFHSLALG